MTFELCAIIVVVQVMCVASTKRLVLHNDQDIATQLSSMQAQFTRLETRLEQVETENQQLQTRLGQVEQENQQLKSVHGGSVYVRWGRSVCPGNGTILTYKGYIGGSRWNTAGGGSNSLCLPDDPTWSIHKDGFQLLRGAIFGTEIDVDSDLSVPVIGYAYDNQDPPCAVCNTQRSNVLMIPGRSNCYPGWTLEYSGYIVTSMKHPVHTESTDYICLDSKPEALPHGQTSDDEHILYYTEAHCGSLPCPPYHDGWELACVVCSK